MALISYTVRTPPTTNLRVYMYDEFQRVQISIQSFIRLLDAMKMPLEVGPPDSAGPGFRTLKIPN